MLAREALRAHFQPIVRLADGATIAYEALVRPQDDVLGNPERFLEAADAAGLRAEAELACWRAAAAAGAPPGQRLLFLNVSPGVLPHPGFLELAATLAAPPVVELTERDALADFDGMREVLKPWVARGALLAIDDVGEGFASLQAILELGPRFVKLSRRLIAGVHLDRRRRALVTLLASYAAETDLSIVAEGIERPEELETLRSLGVHYAQGYLLARPAPAWPEASDAARPRGGCAPRVATDVQGLAEAESYDVACRAVVDHFARRELLMPSIYVERSGVLRCLGLRGYWQLLDGMPAGAGVIGRVYQTGEPIVVDDVERSEDYLEASPGVLAEICVPVSCCGRVVGALNIESPAHLPAGLLEDMTAAASALGAKLTALGSFGPDRPADRLVRHAAALSAAHGEAEIGALATRAATDVSGLGSAAIALGPSAAELEVRAATGPLAGVFAALDPDSLAPMAGWVHGVRSCYTNDEPGGHGFVGHERLRAGGVESIVVVPIEGQHERRGILVVAHEEPRRLDTELVELVELLGAQVSASLATAEAVAALAERASQDPLTGLGHHATFHAALAAARAGLAPGCRVALVLVDIDGFKAVNDTRGHLAGDQLLRSVAAVCASALRAADRLFRIGGDEFAALVEVGDADDVRRVGRRLVDAVRELGSATVSVGAALGELDEGDRELFARADRALYAAKRAGRDTLRVADPPRRPDERQPTLWEQAR
jgi:diguanylate cyclase (GGDEF)-like protein